MSPLAEADPLLRRLIQTELEDSAARREILDDPEFVEAFRAMWSHGKTGLGVARLRRRLRLENAFMTRDLADHVIFRCPVRDWVGRTMADVHAQYLAWRADATTLEDPEARAAFVAFGTGVRDEGEFFLCLLRHFDRDIHWHYVSANRDPAVIKRLLLHPLLLPGFNDSGAHVTNMAYYDGNLRALRIALADSEATFARMVRRLTREPAEFFGLDAGRMDIGSRADLVLIDPVALAGYDGDARIEYRYREAFDCHQLVNRSDGVVAGVYIAGTKVWHGADFTAEFGRVRLGRALTAI